MDGKNSTGQRISLLNGEKASSTTTLTNINTSASNNVTTTTTTTHNSTTSSHQQQRPLSLSQPDLRKAQQPPPHPQRPAPPLHSRTEAYPSLSHSLHRSSYSFSRSSSYSQKSTSGSFSGPASASGSFFPPASRLGSASSTGSASAYRSNTSLPYRVSRTLSAASAQSSTPSLSPETPQLVRSNSTDSADMQDEIETPDFGMYEIGAVPQSKQYGDPTAAAAYYAPSAYSPMVPVPVADMGPYTGMPPLAMPASSIYAAPMAPTDQTAAPAQKPKKNQYACPVAKQYNCSDYFTTSGHAARHAKKHTGKKDAICPDCNKAFTRKDNMEQHRRTHTNGRGVSRTVDDKSKKVKQPLQKTRPKPAPIQANSAMLMDPTLPTLHSLSAISPTSALPLTPGTAERMDSFSRYDLTPNYPDPTQFAMNQMTYTREAGSDSFGLDALALAAASGEKNAYTE